MKILLLPVCAVFAVATTLNSPEVAQLVSGNNQILANIYTELATAENAENFVTSPLSVSLIVALANAGAKGQTAAEITSTLHLPENVEQRHQAFKEIVQGLKGNKNYKLDLANKMYLDDGFDVSQQFDDVAVKVFDAAVENINFKEKELAVETINHWVENHTNNKIKNLISPDDIKNFTRMVLVNALYFQANWKDQFVEEFTRKRNFHLNNVDVVEVDMMSQSNFLNYESNHELNAKFLEIPYAGDEFVMTIALPNEHTGLNSLESRIHEVLAVRPKRNLKVLLALPKFEIVATIQYDEILKKLGIVQAFEEFQANFTGIAADQRDLFIGTVLQKAFISVTESGTEAAASTAEIQIEATSMPVFFEVDRPFLFWISHKESGVNLFVGRVVNPSF